MITIGNVSVERGQKKTGFLKAGEFSDGSPINVPLILVNGTKDGPTLWIGCCIHGNEVAGTYALLKMIKEIDPKSLSGKIIGVPAINITAFWTGGRIPIFDTKDLNRIMPGNPDGSFAEQYASVIYKTAKENADYLIDVHWAGTVDWALFNGDVEMAEKAKELAKSSGFEVIVSDPDAHGGVLDGGLFTVMARHGIPSVILESKNIKKLHIAYTNFLKHLKMIEGEPVIAAEQKLYNGFAWGDIVIKHGGLFHKMVEEGEQVSKGQTIGIMTDIFGEEVEKILSTVDGLVMLGPDNKPLNMGTKPFEIAISV